MATVTVRNLDAGVTQGLKALGQSHGRSMEAEARAILTSAVTQQTSQVGLGSRIHAAFAHLGVEDQFAAPRLADNVRPVVFEE